MSDDKLQKAISRAAQADAFMESDVVKEAFESLEAAYIEFWRQTPPTAQDARESVYIAINVVGKVKHHLAMTISNGKIAQAELDSLNAQKT